MELLIPIIIIAVVAAAAVKILFWVFVGRAILHAGQTAEAEFLQQMQQLEAMMRYAQQHSGPNGQLQLPPQFAAQMMKAQNQFSAMDRLSQQKHETFVSGMVGSASAAGLDVSGWNSSSW